MMHLINLLIFFYLFIRLIVPLPIAWPYRLTYAFLTLLASQSNLINELFLGGMAAPEIPGWLVMTLGWIYASTLLLSVFLLARDVLLSLIYSWDKHGRLRKAILSPLNSSFMLMTAIFVCALGVWRAVSYPTVTTIELRLKDLPPNFEGYRIVHISDIHASRLITESWIDEVVRRTNRLNPDLILLTGDLIDGSPEHRRRDIRSFKLFRATDGTFASLGNHEYYSGVERWLEAFEGIQLPVLVNSHTRIWRGDQSMVLAAVTDPVAEDFDHDAPDLEAALADIDPSEMIILMNHQPVLLQESAARGVDLQLSGHTHGGQVIVLNTLIKLKYQGYLSGLYWIDEMALYISRGAGVWGGFPVRIGVENEITEIILRRPESPETQNHETRSFNPEASPAY